MNYQLQHAQKGEMIMNTWNAMNIVEGFAESDEQMQLEAWSYIIKNDRLGDMRSLRDLDQFIKAGKIDRAGNIL